MDWRLKSEKEVGELAAKGDLIAGYKFWPWLMYRRFSQVIGMVLAASVGVYHFNISEDYNFWFWSGLSFSTITLITFIILSKQYQELKQGIQ